VSHTPGVIVSGIWCTGRVRRRVFDQAVGTGEANRDGAELTHRHCRHARIELVDGNSPVGRELDLPMGLLRVRCEHAPPSPRLGHIALDLAVEFYQDNCVGCPHQAPGGGWPTLATEVVRRAAQETARQEEAQQAAADRARRHEQRRERRRELVAAQGHVIRDLAAALDRIDRGEPRTEPLTGEEDRAARQVTDAAKGAPELFGPVLVTSLLELAADAADPAAMEALEALVRAGRCPPRRALGAASVVLRQHRSAPAVRLLAMLEPDLRPADLPAVLDRLISLASGEEDSRWWPAPAPEGLVAASHVDLPAVTERITAHLGSGDELTRQAAADAARVLLADDAARVIALGPPLAGSIRGEDTGYAGEPCPDAAALRALAEAWREKPGLTRQIIETQAAGAAPEARAALSRVPWFLQRFREPWDALAEATAEAVSFVVRRAGGDWGEEAADHAAEHLTSLAREIPAAVAPHADGMLGTVLALCAADQNAPPGPVSPGVPAELAALERDTMRIRRDARRRWLAGTIGCCAAVSPEAVLTPVQSLFTATTGDAHVDRAVRVTMLTVLEQAVSAETLRDILPVTYTALLDADQVVRSAGIGLWEACAGVAGSLPAELTELSVPLLRDAYVIVHAAMLERIPRLRLPSRLAPVLLPWVAGWARVYAAQPGSRILESAVRALRSLTRDLEDPAQATAWLRAALSYIGKCDPVARRRLLTASWPEELRTDPAWTRAALATAASPELADYYNQRGDPVLAALMDRPWLLADLPLAEIEPLSSIHRPPHSWRALEPAELLQAAGRWADAAAVARSVEAAQPPGAEGRPGRLLAGAVARGAELAQALAAGSPATADLAVLTGAVTSAAAAVEASRAGEPGSRLRCAMDVLAASAAVPAVLLAPVVPDPDAAAGELDRAAGLVLAAPQAHASGAQRAWTAQAWQIAALLMRYDAAVRAASSDAPALLQAARRRAKVLRAEISGAAVPGGLAGFLAAAGSADGPAAAQTAWQQLAAAPLPARLVGTSLLPRRYEPDPPEDPPRPPPRAVCVATLRGVPVTDILVLRPREVQHLGMTVRLADVPDWARTCIIEPVTTLGRDALALPRWELSLADGTADEFGLTLAGEQPLHCAIEQPVLAPALDCPVQVRLAGDGHEEAAEVAGLTRIRLRPFDPGRDTLTEFQQTDARLLEMFAALDAPQFDTENARAFCRLFAACVRAGLSIMFDKPFMRGSRLTEAQFHDELERRLRADPELGGRLTRRDPVAGGFDDLLHDDIIAELKVSRGAPVTLEHCARYIGQPAQYGTGRGSQFSVLVVYDHGGKQAPVGVIENYIGWLVPELHGLKDAWYPSLVGVLIINTNLPVPSALSRRRVRVQPPPGPGSARA
jgi:hypothetical protein